LDLSGVIDMKITVGKFSRVFPMMSAFLFFLLGGAGCSTIMQKTGELLDGSAFEEKISAAYEAGEGIRFEQINRKNGEEFIAIRLEALPTLRLIGTVPDAEGHFSLSSLEFLCPNLKGWNEFSQELIGSGSFRSGGAERILRLTEPPEALDISGGKIRKGSARITGDQALTALRNRQERISVLAEWMKALPEPTARQAKELAFRRGRAQGVDQKDFEERWKPILFPEIVAAKKRPQNWTTEGVVWVRGEDVRWNTVYTGALFPEELQPVRNSGTLLRDWEEAAGWIYLQYEWDRIMESLENEIRLIKIK
jgi:hypothetical protein